MQESTLSMPPPLRIVGGLIQVCSRSHVSVKYKKLTRRGRAGSPSLPTQMETVTLHGRR